MCELVNVIEELHREVLDRLEELADIPVTSWMEEPSPEEIERATLKIEDIVIRSIKLRLKREL